MIAGAGDTPAVYSPAVQLVIAEKPSVARDLARVLGVRATGGRGVPAFEGEHHVITWCIGHLVELEEPAAYDAAWKPWRLDRLPMIPDQFRLRGSRHALGQLRGVTRLLRERRFSAVVNACDAGREGELIFRYVYQHAASRLPIRRLWISSLTDEAIGRGFAALRPGAAYELLADAARSRSEADWLVGMNATRAITVRGRDDGHDALYSVGRVQTPTLAMLVAREHEITAFAARPYWVVTAELRTADGARFAAPWRHGVAARLATAAAADALVARDTAVGEAVVERVEQRIVREPPPQLFDLTSLQRTANRRFGWAAAHTLEVAQALYERHKLITYPRTDSRHLTRDVAAALRAPLAALAEVPAYQPFARVLLDTPPRPGRRIVDDAKVRDHHAIIPTGNPVRLGGLDRDPARLFDLIARRFLAGFFPDAELAVTEAWLRVGAAAGRPPRFAPADREAVVDVLPPPPDRYLARGRTRLVAGWQEVAGIAAEGTARGAPAGTDDDEREATTTLPPLQEGQRLAAGFVATARETTPPPRYTEATLLGAMETAGKRIDDEALREAMKETGLGTPATRAAIIETLLRRGYVVRTKPHLTPTPMGLGLIAAIPVASLTSPELTGAWEARLARIARGLETRETFMADIARYVTELVDAIRGGAAPTGAMPAGPGRAAPSPRRAASPRGRGSGGGTARREPSSGVRTAAPGRPPPRHRDAPAAAVAPRPRRAASKAPPPMPPAAPLTCPRCRQGPLITGARGWGCARWREGCGFVIWFETAGRRLTPVQLRALVERGKTRPARYVAPDGAARLGRLVLAPDQAGGARFEPT